MKTCVSRCSVIDGVSIVRLAKSGSRLALFTTAALLASTASTAVYANEEAADSTNANQLWTGGGLGLNLTGAGVTVGVWEALEGGTQWEVRDTHETFTGRVTFGDSGTGNYSDHATHVAGTIGEAHLPGNQERWGMAPGVQIVSYSASNDNNEMISATQIDISNHSYGVRRSPWDNINWTVSDGGGGTVSKTYDTWSYDWDTIPKDPGYGRYDSSARSLDLALNQRPKLLSFYSAGNSRDDSDDRYTDLQSDGKYVTRFSSTFIANNAIIGEDLGNRYYLVSTGDYALAPHGYDTGGYDSLAGDKAAKNNVVIGAAFDFTGDPHENFAGSISTTGFSSYGPTDDGRLGVDLVANGNSLDSARASSDTSYGRSSGTSMSAPNAAGTAALILEHWRNEGGGYTPDSATQKGLLMHTAMDATGFGSGPDYATGYGMMNAAEAVGHITESVDELIATRDRHAWEDTINEGDVLSFDFIATGDDFKASLSWLDPAAPSQSFVLDDRAIRLVNDLDIWVTDEFGNTFWTWVLDPENPSDAATQDEHNRVDNFTQVFTDTLASDTELTININHFGSLTGGSQDYALFVSGATLVPEPSSLVILAVLGLGLTRRRRG